MEMLDVGKSRWKGTFGVCVLQIVDNVPMNLHLKDGRVEKHGYRFLV
jgi:hypothetical protein